MPYLFFLGAYTLNPDRVSDTIKWLFFCLTDVLTGFMETGKRERDAGFEVYIVGLVLDIQSIR